MKNAGGVSHRENTRITSGRQGDHRQGSRPSKEPVKAALMGRSRVQRFTNSDGTVKQWAPAGGGETMARQASGKGWRSAARKRPQKRQKVRNKRPGNGLCSLGPRSWEHVSDGIPLRADTSREPPRGAKAAGVQSKESHSETIVPSPQGRQQRHKAVGGTQKTEEYGTKTANRYGSAAMPR